MSVNDQLAVALAFVLMFVTCMFHELAHATVLTAAGGRPRRLGIMLFYLVPALFCDVSDSFRLGRRAQVDVAMAGVMFQCQFGAVLAPFLLVQGSVGIAVQHFLLLNLVIVALNRVPFVALDGYFALRASVGVPNLREVAMRAWKHSVRMAMLRHSEGAGRSADGVRTVAPTKTGHRSAPRWVIGYGAAASITPVLMVAWGLYMWITHCWSGGVALWVTIAIGVALSVRVLWDVGDGAGTWLRRWLGGRGYVQFAKVGCP